MKTRPRSSADNTRSSRTGRTSANSTSDWPRLGEPVVARVRFTVGLSGRRRLASGVGRMSPGRRIPSPEGRSPVAHECSPQRSLQSIVIRSRTPPESTPRECGRSRASAASVRSAAVSRTCPRGTPVVGRARQESWTSPIQSSDPHRIRCGEWPSKAREDVARLLSNSPLVYGRKDLVIRRRPPVSSRAPLNAQVSASAWRLATHAQGRAGRAHRAFFQRPTNPASPPGEAWMVTFLLAQTSAGSYLRWPPINASHGQLYLSNWTPMVSESVGSSLSMPVTLPPRTGRRTGRQGSPSCSSLGCSSSYRCRSRTSRDRTDCPLRQYTSQGWSHRDGCRTARRLQRPGNGNRYWLQCPARLGNQG